MDDFDKWTKEQDNKSKFQFKIFENAKPWHYALLFILIVLASFIAKSSQSKWVWIALGGLVVLFIISMFKQGGKREPIPRALAQLIAQRDLQIETDGNRAYAHGTKIFPTGYFKDQSWNDGNGPMLFKYNIGFLIQEPGKSGKEIVYQMDPYPPGRCKGIIESSLGFSGEDIKDREIIFPDKIIKDDKNINLNQS